MGAGEAERLARYVARCEIRVERWLRSRGLAETWPRHIQEKMETIDAFRPGAMFELTQRVFHP